MMAMYCSNNHADRGLELLLTSGECRMFRRAAEIPVDWQ